MKEGDMILVYVTCESTIQAKKIGKHLMDKRLCACVNIFPNMQSFSFWPPKRGEIEEAKEAVLIIKTLDSKYQAIENEIRKIHTYEVPCIFSIPVKSVSKKYFNWIKGELK